MTLSVAVVDDDADLAGAVARLLGRHGHAARAFASAGALLAALDDPGDKVPPACLVSDIQLGDHDGFALAQTLRAQHPTMALVFMTAWPTTADAVDAVRRHGGLDYLEKPLDEGRLLAAVAEGLAWATGQQRRQAVLAALTRRERAVFDLLVRGHGNKDIADRLGISVRTVEDHRAAVMAKTGAAGLAGLMSLVGQSQEGGCSASAPMAQKRC
jgi:FixJ family two-component response regulator